MSERPTLFMVDKPEQPVPWSVVLDRRGMAWQLGQNGMWRCVVSANYELDWFDLWYEFGPITVIHEARSLSLDGYRR